MHGALVQDAQDEKPGSPSLRELGTRWVRVKGGHGRDAPVVAATTSLFCDGEAIAFYAVRRAE